MLCNVCRRSLEGIHDPTVTPRLRAVPSQDDCFGRALFDVETYVFGHHRTHDSMLHSIEQQCLLCVEYKDHGHDSTPAGDGYFTTFTVTITDNYLLMLVKCGVKDSKPEFFTPLECEPASRRLNLEMDDNTDGQYARKLIDEWDKNCLVNHLQCGKISDFTFLPTRMLEIKDVSNPTTCTLVLREEVPLGSRYNALSYCWGTAKKQGRMCLSQSTFNTIRTGLPLGSLPKTYVDAIRVTARLGIQYIWIDALCIIQDSPYDWRFEASTMQAVYRNSYLTISAVAGAHDDCGLFYPRDPVKMQPTVVKIAYTFYDKPKLFVHDKEYGVERRSWEVGKVTTSRGWCLQERLLAPRVLHFGAQQLFWECYEQHACESIPGSTSYSLDSVVERTRLWKRLFGEPYGVTTGDSYQDLFVEWYDLLSSYSHCQLTYASDKLVAISGLANDMKAALNTCRPGIHHTYLAGLWAEDLRFSLCWLLQGIGRRPAAYRAPSWSPMSLDGPTRWDMPIMRDSVIWYVEDADCLATTHCVDGSDTGEVAGGQLELRGPWTTIQTVAAMGETLNTRRLSCLQYSDPISALETHLPLIRALVYYDTQDDMVEQAFCIPIHATWHEFRGWTFQGIVLVPVQDERLTYRRIGLVIFDLANDKTDAAVNTEDVAQAFFSPVEKRSVTVI